MAMKEITIDKIKSAIESAVYIDRLLPSLKLPKCHTAVFDIVYTPQEIAFMDKVPKKPRPNQHQVSVWEEVVFEWLPLLTPYERRLVWKRGGRIPWKLLCTEFGMSRTHLLQKHNNSLIKIKFYLLGKQNCTVQKRSVHFTKK